MCRQSHEFFDDTTKWRIWELVQATSKIINVADQQDFTDCIQNLMVSCYDGTIEIFRRTQHFSRNTIAYIHWKGKGLWICCSKVLLTVFDDIGASWRNNWWIMLHGGGWWIALLRLRQWIAWSCCFSASGEIAFVASSVKQWASLKVRNQCETIIFGMFFFNVSAFVISHLRIIEQAFFRSPETLCKYCTFDVRTSFKVGDENTLTHNITSHVRGRKVRFICASTLVSRIGFRREHLDK